MQSYQQPLQVFSRPFFLQFLIRVTKIRTVFVGLYCSVKDPGDSKKCPYANQAKEEHQEAVGQANCNGVKMENDEFPLDFFLKTKKFRHRIWIQFLKFQLVSRKEQWAPDFSTIDHFSASIFVLLRDVKYMNDHRTAIPS
jgi:hypothetical protein